MRLRLDPHHVVKHTIPFLTPQGTEEEEAEEEDDEEEGHKRLHLTRQLLELKTERVAQESKDRTCFGISKEPQLRRRK